MLSMTWLEHGRVYRLTVGKQFIYLSAWRDPLFVGSRLPQKVYFEGESKVLLHIQVDTPFPLHQCHVENCRRLFLQIHKT